MSTSFPISRIRTIMRSSPDVETIGHDAPFLVGKATEIFIQFLTTKAFEKSGKKKLEYKELAEIVQTDDRLDFLREWVPRKITVRQFKGIMKKKSVEKNGIGSSEETESDSDSDQLLVLI